MATQTLATADAILKELYVGPVIEQLNYKSYILDQIERDSDHIDFTGRRAVVPVHSARNRGRAGITDGGTLPSPGKQGYLDAIVPIRYVAQGISLTDQSIKQADGGNDQAFINLLDNDVQTMTKDLRKDINRMVYGDGTGLLGTVATGVTSATIVLDSTQYVFVGDTVDVVTKSTGAPVASGTGLTVTSVTKSTQTVVLSGSVTVTTAEGLFLTGGYSASGGALVPLEIEGLREFATTGRTLHGINSATAGNEFWNSNVRNAGASQASLAVAGESLFEQLADDVGAQGQGELTTFITSRGIRRRLADTYQSQKRFNDANAVEVHGGYSAIMVNEIPVISDDDCPRTLAFGINNDALKWFQIDPPGWLSDPKDGVTWQLATSATGGGHKAQWDAWFVWYANLGCLAPNRLGKIQFATDDLT